MGKKTAMLSNRAGSRLSPYEAAALAAVTAAGGAYNYFRKKPVSKPKSRVPTSQSTDVKFPYPNSNTMTVTETQKKRRYQNAQNVRKKRSYFKGVDKGKFPATQRYKTNTTYDVIERSQTGSIATCPITKTLYIGHCAGGVPRMLLRNVFRVIVKKLFEKAGVTISNWNDIIATHMQPSAQSFSDMDTFLFKYSYKNITNNLITLQPAGYYFNFRTLSTYSYSLLVDAFIDYLQQQLVAIPQNFNELHFVDFTLSFGKGEVCTTIASVLSAENLSFSIDSSSTLTLQNATKSADNSASTDVVNSNPIKCRMYSSNKWLNGFTLARSTLLSEPSRVPFYCYPDNGIISTHSGESQTDILTKPPAPWVFGCKNMSNSILNPGEIKKTVCYFKVQKIGFNTLMQKLCKYITLSPTEQGSLPRIFEMGNAQLFGIQSDLYDRTENVPLTVSYQLDQRYSLKAIVAKPKTLDIINTI